jgi:hypothetical protein
VRTFSKTLAPRYEVVAQVEYFLQGSPQLQRPFADRGRLMSQMDRELIEILFPGFAEKTDYSVTPAQPLGSRLHWNWTPDLRTIVDGDGSILRRIATVSVSFHLQDIPN